MYKASSNNLTPSLVLVMAGLITDFRIFGLEEEYGKLIFANVLFRHGDRTPIDPYPNDPYRNESYWPVGFGQLTNTGKEQEYDLGKWLRTRYNALLTEEYNPDIVRVVSTDVDRTLMSAELVLAAIYPPNEHQRWNPYLNWQPAPIHSIPTKLDKVLAAQAPCPAYHEEMKRVLNSKELKDLKTKYSDVFNVLNENCGKNITTFEDLEYVFNTLYIESLNNLTLPAWTKDVFPAPMEEAATYSFALPTWTLKLARLKTGLLVQDMISHMKTKAQGRHKNFQNIWLYSAHDSTIGNLLNTLGVFDLQNPPYSSTVMMELRRDSQGRHNVMLFYRNSTSREPYLLTLPGCQPACPLDQFVVQCEAVIPRDWDHECQPSLTSASDKLSYNITLAVLVISCLLISLLVISVVLYRQKKKRPTHCRGYAQFYMVPWEGDKPTLQTSGTKSFKLVPSLYL